MIEHELVELLTEHLPGLRTLVRLMVGEGEGLGESTVLRDELDAVLLHEVALPQLGATSVAVAVPDGPPPGMIGRRSEPSATRT